MSQTRLEITLPSSWYLDDDIFALERPEFNPADAADFWDLVNRQDCEIVKRVQQGMYSRVFEHGFCAPMEDLTLDIRKYVTERIGPHLMG